MTCAIPPLDQSEVRIGRGYGVGSNREGTTREQLHAGMDFVAGEGSPVLAVIPGVVDFVTRNTGPRISVTTARAGEAGQVRRMSGYGNGVVLRHDFDVPGSGLPNPFWTSYNHLSAVAPGIAPGAVVNTGTLIGQVGNTTNGQFPGMGMHVHFEVRRAEFPGPVGRDSYRLDTVDPYVLLRALGMDWVGSRREDERQVGGQLFIRADGPSGPAACPRTAAGLAGMAGWAPLVAASVPLGVPGVPLVGMAEERALDGLFGFGTTAVPSGYVDPLLLKPTYARKGTTQAPREGSPAANVMPPDYAASLDSEEGGSSGGSAGGLVLGVGAVAVFAALMMRRR
jgi:murein DD-endopeptidase MepM/ murein hydrolase activator NlpD